VNNETRKSAKKFIFVTGGVSSSLGKGLAAAATAALLERRGIKINMLKMDPYINVDPGTMSPTQHGEVFVTDDGAETDLDLGHYERFTSLTLSKSSNFTTGQVYLEVIESEREGKYLGKTVQVVPHITDEIKRRIHVAAGDADLLIGEIGGTVGDIESLPFLEAIRQFASDVGHENVLFVHLVLIPYLSAAGELKSKPAQHSVKELRSIGLTPNLIICRSDREVDQSILDKISLFCNVPKNNVFSSIDLDSIYKVPMSFYDQKLDARITELLGMWTTAPKIRHGAIANQANLKLHYIDAEELTDDKKRDEILTKVQGVLVPGGFGQRGTEGKIKAIEFARVNKIPYFGICLGMQLALIEYARNVAGIKEATSEEFGSEGVHVVHYMEGQSVEGSKGGTMRLGAYDCELQAESLAGEVYGKNLISERHRHRLEVNNSYREQLEKAGLRISGENKKHGLVEVIEVKDHPYFIGCQYHPEFKSKPFAPHPLFERFIKESMNHEN